MKVDVERLRRVAASDGWGWHVDTDTLAALLAVVDAAREATRREGLYGKYGDVTPLVAALKPFTPPADRAWEEVDRWNAEQDVKCNAFPESERDLAVKAAVDSTRDRVPRVPPGAFQAVLDRDRNPRDRARDQLADAGVAVQRQFRSDQERIAELESERDALRKELDARRADVRELETDAAATAGDLCEYEELVEKLKLELVEWRGRHKAVTNGLSNHVARADRAEARLARVPALVEALKVIADMPDHWAVSMRSTATNVLAAWEKP